MTAGAPGDRDGRKLPRGIANVVILGLDHFYVSRAVREAVSGLSRGWPGTRCAGAHPARGR
jgi:hypothetical protein